MQMSVGGCESLHAPWQCKCLWVWVRVFMPLGNTSVCGWVRESPYPLVLRVPVCGCKSYHTPWYCECQCVGVRVTIPLGTQVSVGGCESSHTPWYSECLCVGVRVTIPLGNIHHSDVWCDEFETAFSWSSYSLTKSIPVGMC